ncbi:hypothetical protein TARUN_1415 [Trichoderma arundinaceum]|uniref:Uncharacterized protein n=1 Tax=Trichoderma arundinaceum TaxID=490622 RepID=A0A395NXG3_TRIAR|nr:hypothetical protein TARUN_1415 [Trichoderma arundinaceum]
MAELSDIEEGYSSGALGHDAEERQGKKSDVASRPENPGYGHAYDPWTSIGKAKGKMFQRQRYDLQHHQSSPNSVAVVSSSPPSLRTMTLTDSALPSQRSSSSGTVHVASAEASNTTLSRAESSAWSSIPGPPRISGVTSGTTSSATASGYYRHDYSLRQQSYRQNMMRDVLPSVRLPF